MKKLSTFVFAALLGSAVLSSCTTSTIVAEDDRDLKTSVVLSQNNYKVVATQVKGESEGFHILSAIPTSIPTSLEAASGMVGGADGGIAITSATKAAALADLYKKCGELRNRSTAFINIREEKSGVNWLLFSRPKYIITADLIEYVK